MWNTMEAFLLINFYAHCVFLTDRNGHNIGGMLLSVPKPIISPGVPPCLHSIFQTRLLITSYSVPTLTCGNLLPGVIILPSLILLIISSLRKSALLQMQKEHY